ncbi:hypothetical protein SELMODRAFT_426921 [Selaginella moellendorffii]|uniref:Arf-GAP domain-containing protein n=2 Tax=Selaginella moellendorffii TaxID=88036 RepID=D8SXX6_SELML|nr:hypothetical protein SELMODRAFT_426921 [Selaginella moellendorffii]
MASNAQKEADSHLKALMAWPENQKCADCGASKPRFASITLAVFLCNRCYGIHRGVGAHITRTKCVGLDRWGPEEVHRMKCIGNAVASAYWEQRLPQGIQRPSPESPDSEVERWIRDKYEKRLFCPPDLPPPEAPKFAIEETGASVRSSDWKPFG